MKKQILAAAVAGAFAVPALAAADSSVTLFGQLQTQVVYHDAEDLTGIEDGFKMHDGGGVGQATDGANPNRIGVRVAHDLGGGLTGLAKIEQNVTSTDGFDSGARDVYVGLDTDFGTFMGGRMTSPYSTAGKDPLNATFLQARTNGGRLAPMSGFGNGSYLDRVVAYANDFGPVSFTGALVMDNTDDSNIGFAGRLSFDAGPAEIYGAYQQADEHEQAQDAFGGMGDDFGLTNTVIEDVHTAKIGVDWSDGPFRVVAEIEDYNIEASADQGSGDLAKGNTFFLSGTYTMGRNDFVLNIGFTDEDSDVAEVETLYVAAGVKHNFSNRVMAYGGLAYTDVDNDTTGFDEDGMAIGGGMRVSF